MVCMSARAFSLSLSLSLSPGQPAKHSLNSTARDNAAEKQRAPGVGCSQLLHVLCVMQNVFSTTECVLLP